MCRLVTVRKFFLQEDEGASLVEYAMLIAFIALLAIGGIKLLGGDIGSMFTTIGSKLKNSTSKL